MNDHAQSTQENVSLGSACLIEFCHIFRIAQGPSDPRLLPLPVTIQSMLLPEYALSLFEVISLAPFFPLGLLRLWRRSRRLGFEILDLRAT